MSDETILELWGAVQQAFLSEQAGRAQAALDALSAARPALSALVRPLVTAAAMRRAGDFDAAGLAIAEAAARAPLADWPPLGSALALLRLDLAALKASADTLAGIARAARSAAGDEHGPLLDQLGALDIRLSARRAPQALRQGLAELRDQLEQSLGPEARYARARSAADSGDFEAVLRLLEGPAIGPTAALRQNAQYMRDFALRERAALQFRLRPLTELDRDDFAAQQRAAAQLSASDAASIAGRALLAPAARLHAALAVLRAVDALAAALARLEADPIAPDPAQPDLGGPWPSPAPGPGPHDPDDTAILMTGQALSRLAAALGEARRAVRAGEYRAAQAALADAEPGLGQSEAAGLPLPALTAGLSAAKAAIQRLQESLAAAQDQLVQIEAALQRADLSEARALAATLRAGSLAPAVADTLAQLEQRIDAAEQGVAALVARAQILERAGRALDAAEAYREAHRRYAGAPGVAQALEASLVRAGEAVRARDEALALALFEEALALNPKNQAALAARAPIALSSRLREGLDRIDQGLLALHQQPESQPEELAPLRDDLATLQRVAADQPDVAAQIARLEERLVRQEAGRQRYLELRAQAGASRDSGAWETAAAQLQHAVAALALLPDLPAPRWAEAELERWRAAVGAIAAARREAPSLRDQGFELLKTVSTKAELARVEQIAADLGGLVERALAAAAAAGGPAPEPVVSLREALFELQGQVGELAAVFELPAPQRLKAIQQTLALRPDAPLLRDLLQRLGASLADEIPAYLERAAEAEAQGTLAEARAALRDVLALAPNHPAATASLAALEQRQQIEQALTQAERAATLPSASLTQARDTLDAALRQLLDPGAPTPGEVRAPLEALLSSSDEAALGSLTSPAGWSAALAQSARLRAGGHWLARRAAPLADRWLALAREAAVRGVLATLAQVGAVLDAYELAAQYRRDHPVSEVALSFLEETQIQLRSALRAAAEKQLTRAEELLAQGDAATALTLIEGLDEQYYAPIAQRFPGLLDQIDDDAGTLSRQRSVAIALRERAAALAARDKQAEGTLSQANTAFTQNDLQEARKLLRSLPDLRMLPLRHADAEALSAQIVRLEEQEADRLAAAVLQRARLALDRPLTQERLEAIQADLAALSEHPSWPHVPEDSRQRWEELWTRCGQRLAWSREARAWQQEIAAAREAGDEQRELLALERVAEREEDPVARAAAERRRAELRTRLELRQRYEAALAAGQSALVGGSFGAALQALLEATRAAGRLSAEALAESAELLGAARAGVQVERARERLEAGAGLLAGRAELSQAAQILTGSGRSGPLSVEMAALVAAEREQLEGRLEELESSLRRAREALAAGDLTAARQAAQAARRIDSAHQAVRRLADDIEQQHQATQTADLVRALLQQAEEEWQRGNEPRAEALAQRLLELAPDHAQGLALAAEIRAGAPGAAILADAQNLIFAGKFRAAEERLRQAEAARANPIRLKAVQRLLDDLKADYQTAHIYPIRELARNERFAEALERIDRELGKDLYDRLAQDLSNLREEIVRRWPEQALQRAPDRLRAAQAEADYRAVQEELERVLTLPGPFPERPRIERYLRQAQIGLLNDKLRLIELSLRYHLSNDPARKGAAASELDQHTRQRLLEEAPAQLEEARAVVTAVEREVQQLGGLAQLHQRAELLQRQIDDALRVRDELRRSEERAQALANLRRLVEAAAALTRPEAVREDLAAALAASSQGLGAQLPARDPDLVALRQKIELFDQGAAQIEELERTLRGGELTGAAALAEEIAHLPPGLGPRFVSLRQMIERLTAADDAAQAEQWASAIEAYQQARAALPELRLGALLAPRIAVCQERLTDELVSEVGPGLEAATPNELAGLIARIQRALDSGWVAQQRRAEVERLRDFVVVRQLLAETEPLLTAAPPEPERALVILDRALSLPGARSMSPALARLQTIALAQVALQQENLGEAERQISRLAQQERAHPAVASLEARLVQARAALNQRLRASALGRARDALGRDNLQEAASALREAQALADAADPEVRSLEQAIQLRRAQLDDVETTIRQAQLLRAAGDLQGAAERLARVSPGFGSYPPWLIAVDELQHESIAASEELAAQSAFRRAIALCQAARSLQASPALDAQLERLSEQAAHALESTDLAAQAALIAWDRPGLQALYSRLLSIDPGSPLVGLWRTTIEHIDHDAPEVLRLMGEGWETLERFATPSAMGGMVNLYAQAAGLFAQAAERAPELPEASAWAAYAEQMRRGVELAPGAANSSAACEQTGAAFQRAAAALRELKVDFAAAPGGAQRVRARRQRAIYNAEQLAALAAGLLPQVRRYELEERAAVAEDQGPFGAAPSARKLSDLLRQIRQLRDDLVARSRIYGLEGSAAGAEPQPGPERA